MKTIYQILTEAKQEPIEIDRFNAKMDWSKKWKGVIDWTNKHMGDWSEDMANILNEYVAQFYKDNPRKRNCGPCEVSTEIYLCLTPQDSSLDVYNKLKAEYQRIGMATNHMTFDNQEIAHVILNGQSSERAAATDPSKIKTKTYPAKARYDDREYGNAYNRLPSETVVEYREKLADCIKNTEVIVKKQLGSIGIFGHGIGKIIVTIVPVYDKAKLNKLYDEISNNQELQNYAEHLESTSRAISAYYDEKRTNRDYYTGD